MYGSGISGRLEWESWTSPIQRRAAGTQDKLRTLLAMGVDCFKTDFGERIPLDVVYYDGSDPAKMHNYYSYLFNKVVFDLLKEVKGDGEAVVFARSGTAGSQKFPVHWGGDNAANYESMAESRAEVFPSVYLVLASGAMISAALNTLRHQRYTNGGLPLGFSAHTAVCMAIFLIGCLGCLMRKR